MKRPEIEVLYNQFRRLDGWNKEEILFSLEDLQRKRDAQHSFTLASITMSASLATLITASAISSDIAELGVNSLTASNLVFTGLVGIGASAIMPAIAKQLRRHSTYIEEMLGDVISEKERLPRTLVFSRTISAGDRAAMANLAIEKHKEITSKLTKNKSGDIKKTDDYFYIEVKYRAINISKSDKQFFNNAYQSLERNFKSTAIHECSKLKENIIKEIISSSNGDLSNTAIRRSYLTEATSDPECDINSDERPKI